MPRQQVKTGTHNSIVCCSQLLPAYRADGVHLFPTPHPLMPHQWTEFGHLVIVFTPWKLVNPIKEPVVKHLPTHH